MYPSLYTQIMNESYSHVFSFSTTKEGLMLTICTGFVVGFAIGVSYAMKKFLDVKE